MLLHWTDIGIYVTVITIVQSADSMEKVKETLCMYLKYYAPLTQILQ